MVLLKSSSLFIGGPSSPDSGFEQNSACLRLAGGSFGRKAGKSEKITRISELFSRRSEKKARGSGQKASSPEREARTSGKIARRSSERGRDSEKTVEKPAHAVRGFCVRCARFGRPPGSALYCFAPPSGAGVCGLLDLRAKRWAMSSSRVSSDSPSALVRQYW